VLRWRWALACGLCGFALLAGMRLLYGKVTVALLELRIDQEVSSPGHFLEEHRKPISARLVGTLEWLRLGVPNWLSEHAKRPSAVRSRRQPEQIIASSRWPLRRAIAGSMVGNQTRAKFLVENWKDYIPVIRAVWEALRQQSHQTGGEGRNRIFGMLFRL
jgi:hypothetical protein